MARVMAARDLRSREVRCGLQSSRRNNSDVFDSYDRRASPSRFQDLRYSQLHNHQSPSPLSLWGQQKAHSAEQQLALLAGPEFQSPIDQNRILASRLRLPTRLINDSRPKDFTIETSL